MRTITINESRTEIFNDVYDIEEIDPNYFKIGGHEGIRADLILILPD